MRWSNRFTPRPCQSSLQRKKNATSGCARRGMRRRQCSDRCLMMRCGLSLAGPIRKMWWRPRSVGGQRAIAASLHRPEAVPMHSAADHGERNVDLLSRPANGARPALGALGGTRTGPCRPPDWRERRPEKLTGHFSHVFLRHFCCASVASSRRHLWDDSLLTPSAL